MPTLLVKVAPPPAPAVRAALVHTLTELSARLLRKRPEVTVVIVEALEAASWHVGAQPLHGSSALLEISITAGTNSAQEKRDFVGRAHEELRRHLAPLGPYEPASYVIVRELPDTDWGYEGRTQRDRRVAPDQTLAPGRA